MSKKRKPQNRIKGIKSNGNPRSNLNARPSSAGLGPGVSHHMRMIHTGLGILDSEGVAMPKGEPVLAIHPTQDEVMIIVPGVEGEHPFARVITEGWLDCFFVVGYTPRFVSNICEPGALMVIRRFKERPSDQYLGQMVATEWEGLVRP